MMKKKTVWIALLMCLLVAFAGCKATNKKIDTEKMTKETQNFDTQETKFYTTDEDCYSIGTKYGTLQYPEKWREFTKIKIRNEDPYTVQFFCVTSVGDVSLFDLTFNGGDGYRLGSMKVDGQNVTIYIDANSFDQGILSEDEYLNCCAMGDDVNVILEHLVEDYGFLFG